MPTKVSGVIAALFKQLHKEQGRQTGLRKCDGKLETVITSPPWEHLGSVAILVLKRAWILFLRALCQIIFPDAGWGMTH